MADQPNAGASGRTEAIGYPYVVMALEAFMDIPEAFDPEQLARLALKHIHAQEAELSRLRAVVKEQKRLPSALLIGAEEREALARAVRQVAQGRIKNIEAYALADAILAAGWRKVAAVDREKLVEEIAKQIHLQDDMCGWEPWCGEGPHGEEPIDEEQRAKFRALAQLALARAEWESYAGS
ncbi:MAG TPA: hypothetical protein VLT57_06970 [Bryobacteraceae bacterium]|nr:hypothetical protein [Bryobacteraceae bacterium]